MAVKIKSWMVVAAVAALLLISACSGSPATATPPPTLTATDLPTAVPTLTFTPTLEYLPVVTATGSLPTSVPVDGTSIPPVIDTDLVAPLYIALPETWSVANAVIQMPDGGTEFGLLPFSVYRGPVTGGTGYITVVWGFHNITTVQPMQEAGAQINLRADGIRLLNLAILDPGCNIGIDVDREFRVGQGYGAGAYFAATDCPSLPDGTPPLPDTKGWFVVTKPSDPTTGLDLNFAFYVYTDPAVALEGAAEKELETMMESITFDFSMLPTSEPATTSTVVPTP